MHQRAAHHAAATSAAPLAAGLSAVNPPGGAPPSLDAIIHGVLAQAVGPMPARAKVTIESHFGALHAAPAACRFVELDPSRGARLARLVTDLGDLLTVCDALISGDLAEEDIAANSALFSDIWKLRARIVFSQRDARLVLAQLAAIPAPVTEGGAH